MEFASCLPVCVWYDMYNGGVFEKLDLDTFFLSTS